MQINSSLPPCQTPDKPIHTSRGFTALSLFSEVKTRDKQEWEGYERIIKWAGEPGSISERAAQNTGLFHGFPQPQLLVFLSSPRLARQYTDGLALVVSKARSVVQSWSSCRLQDSIVSTGGLFAVSKAPLLVQSGSLCRLQGSVVSTQLAPFSSPRLRC